MQSILVLGSGSVPDDDGGGEDKLILPLEVLSGDGAHEAEGFHSVNWGVALEGFGLSTS